MKQKIVYGVALGFLLCGCINAERKAEYGAWKSSDDGIANVTFETFEAKYQQGWRERAEQKKKKRLAAEEAARVLAQRQSEYDAWRASDDFRDGVTLEVFEQKYKNGWRDRAEQKKKVRIAEEAKERVEREAREAKEREAARLKAEQEALKRRRYTFVEMLATNELAKIREAYSKGKKYGNPYRYNVKSEYKKIWEDWLSTWTAPRLSLTKRDRGFSNSFKETAKKYSATFRLSLTEEDHLTGEALLAEFGTKYLPVAFANYEKIKNLASELQQVFNENFPQPWAITQAGSKWSSFNKTLEKFTRVRTDYFVFHDELCHYWLAWRLGVLSADDLAKLDSKYLGVRLLPENVEWSGQTRLAFCEVEAKLAEFAAKYAPESYAIYQKLEREYNELDKLLKDVVKQIGQLDYVRFDRTLAAAVDKRKDIARESIMLFRSFEAWNMDHRTTEKSAEDIAKCDHEMALSLKPFVASLPNYIRERVLGPVIARSEMVPVPNGVISVRTRVLLPLKVRRRKKDSFDSDWEEKIVSHQVNGLKVQRTEVTQLQWMEVMGNNPSEWSRGADFPVQDVSWDDCQEFIKRLNAMDGTHYRLPTKDEWVYACRAGAKGKWGKRRNGEEGPLEVMGWSEKDAKKIDSYCFFPVALKEPNAWGIFDMHGNVEEWCADGDESAERKDYKYCCGGTCARLPWEHDDYSVTSSYTKDPRNRNHESGFRLVTTQD